MKDAEFTAYEARCATANRLTAAVLPHNKQVLFDVLNAAGIAVVTAEFDGFGDNGQLDSLIGFDTENNEVPIPTDDLVVKVVKFETGTIGEQTTTPCDYIERLLYDFLDNTHSGWETGEGAHGVFRFSLSERTITLDYNERFIDYTHHKHEF